MYSAEEIRELITSGNKKKFYDDRYWRYIVRPKILLRDNFECQECKKEGKVSTQEDKKKLDIHHKRELEKFPELAYCEENLETVCVHHHNILDNKGIFRDKSKKQKFVNEERW